MQRDDASDAASREAKRREKEHVADDAQELLVLPAPKRTLWETTQRRTHAEATQEAAQLRQQATKQVGERLALAQEGHFAELLRTNWRRTQNQIGKTRGT